MSKVSVVIPTHNNATFIEECFKSVVSQSYYKYIKEIFIIDDGSTDNTSRILSRLKMDCDKLEIITTKGLGVAAARNIGIKSSTSSFIAFLDGDDYWTKNKLENQLKHFEKNISIGLVYGNYYSFEKQDASDAYPVYVRSLNNFYEDQLKDYFIKDAPIVPSTTIIKKEVFESVGLFNEEIKTGEDTEMCLRIAEKWKFFYINSIDLFKRSRKGQMSEHLESFFEDQIKITQIFISRNPLLKKFSKKRNSYRASKVSFDYLFKHNNKKKSIIYTIKSLKFDIFNIRALSLIFFLILPYKLTTYLYITVKNNLYRKRKKNI